MSEKYNRMMGIFYRLLLGEMLSIKKLAQEYGVSTKTISRDFSHIQNFLSEYREEIGWSEIKFDNSSKCHYLNLESFIKGRELLAVIQILIGVRAIKKETLLKITNKLKERVTPNDRNFIDKILSRELYHYRGVYHDCHDILDNIRRLSKSIEDKREITVHYYKMNREFVERRIKPVALTFSEHYYYLIAFRLEEEKDPIFFRVDRIVDIVVHRANYKINFDFDIGALKSLVQLMTSGEYRKIRFAFKGRSIQAILDKLPTSRVINIENGWHIVEAEIYGKGVNMFLLSQGSAVKALSPPEFVEEMRGEITEMMLNYQGIKI